MRAVLVRVCVCVCVCVQPLSMMTVENTPDALFDLAQRCCEYDPEKRPTFKEVSVHLAKAETVHSINGVGYHLTQEEFDEPEVNRPSCKLQWIDEQAEQEQVAPRQQRRGSVNPLIGMMKNGPPTNRSGSGRITDRASMGSKDGPPITDRASQTFRGTKDGPERLPSTRGRAGSGRRASFRGLPGLAGGGGGEANQAPSGRRGSIFGKKKSPVAAPASAPVAAPASAPVAAAPEAPPAAAPPALVDADKAATDAATTLLQRSASEYLAAKKAQPLPPDPPVEA